MKSPAHLLSMLALLSVLSLPLNAADSGEPEGAPAPSAIEVADEPSAPRLPQRSDSIMGAVTFDHDMHAEELEIECDECHHETNASPLNYPHADYFHDLWIDCGTCHRPPGSPDPGPQSCYDCHDTKLRDIADERLSLKVILHENCWKCHEVETGPEASESCKLCHSE